MLYRMIAMNMRAVAMLILCAVFVSVHSNAQSPAILNPQDFTHYVDYFNRMEDENISQAISNDIAAGWMQQNAPLFECPQDNFEEMFIYRWWTLRKHIKQTPAGYAFTEFLVDRSYSDQYNLISCALGHHIHEARWLRDPQYADQTAHVWYRGNEGGPMKKLRAFSSWTAAALLDKYKVDGNREYLLDMLPDLIAEFEAWEQEKGREDGLFWQFDVRDGMEEQISGGRRVKNMRPTINSYMFGNARAISEIAAMAGQNDVAKKYADRAAQIKALFQEKGWNPEREFFETVLEQTGKHANVREAIGFIPWYFNLPDAQYSIAWKQLTDEQGFWAPFGLTTAERRHPDFRTHGCCNCEWDGAVWPFATAQTLTGMANLLNSYQQDYVDNADYFKAMERYVESQYYRGRPYVGEYLDETTGYWLKGDQERSRYYNHSTFNDLMITGLLGLRPRADNRVEVNPLLPEGTWDWFCLDAVPYHGRLLTIVWDKSGEKYGRGAGLQVLANGQKIASSEKLECITGELPQ